MIVNLMSIEIQISHCVYTVPNDSGNARLLPSRMHFKFRSGSFAALVKLSVFSFQRAQEKGVKLMLDAEYTYIQASIDLIILALQQKYNQHIPVVYNTYQCYRKVDDRSLSLTSCSQS